MRYSKERQAAFKKMREMIASQPQSVNDLHMVMFRDFGFSKKIVLEFLDLHEPYLDHDDNNGLFRWKS